MSSAKVVSDKDALAFITKKLKTRNNMYDNLQDIITNNQQAARDTHSAAHSVRARAFSKAFDVRSPSNHQQFIAAEGTKITVKGAG